MTAIDIFNESELLRKFQNDDEAAFDYFYQTYSPHIYRKLLKMVKVDILAQELLQDVFVKVWEKKHLIDPEQSFKPYLFRIAENIVFDFYRKLGRENKLQNEVRKHIILFQEMNRFTDASLETFAKSYDHNYSALLKYDGYPTAITSRYPLTNIAKIRTGQTHGYIYAKSNGIHLFSVHLSPSSLADRIKEAKAIVEHANSLPKGEKIIIAGDLNSYNEFDSKAYPPFLEERKKYAPNVDMNFEATNALLNAGFKDAYALLNTMFKATVPILNNKNGNPNQGSRYDYIYLSEDLGANCVYSDVLQNNYTDYASDHYPVYIRISN